MLRTHQLLHPSPRKSNNNVPEQWLPRRQKRLQVRAPLPPRAFPLLGRFPCQVPRGSVQQCLLLLLLAEKQCCSLPSVELSRVAAPTVSTNHPTCTGDRWSHMHLPHRQAARCDSINKHTSVGVFPCGFVWGCPSLFLCFVFGAHHRSHSERHCINKPRKKKQKNDKFWQLAQYKDSVCQQGLAAWKSPGSLLKPAQATQPPHRTGWLTCAAARSSGHPRPLSTPDRAQAARWSSKRSRRRRRRQARSARGGGRRRRRTRKGWQGLVKAEKTGGKGPGL